MTYEDPSWIARNATEKKEGGKGEEEKKKKKGAHSIHWLSYYRDLLRDDGWAGFWEGEERGGGGGGKGEGEGGVATNWSFHLGAASSAAIVTKNRCKGGRGGRKERGGRPIFLRVSWQTAEPLFESQRIRTNTDRGGEKRGEERGGGKKKKKNKQAFSTALQNLLIRQKFLRSPSAHACVAEKRKKEKGGRKRRAIL